MRKQLNKLIASFNFFIESLGFVTRDEHISLIEELRSAESDLVLTEKQIEQEKQDYNSLEKDVVALEETVAQQRSKITMFRSALQHTKNNLSAFETRKMWTVNGTRMKLSNWLKQWREFEDLYKWMKENKHLKEYSPDESFERIVSDAAERIRKMTKPRKNYTRDRVENWYTPTEVIENNFKADCDDITTFAYYFLCAQLYHVKDKDFDNKYEKHKGQIYFNVGPAVNKNGWALENHAYLIVENLEKFYLFESTGSYKHFDKLLFKKPFPDNKFPYPVYMSSVDKDYFRPILRNSPVVLS